MYTVKTLKSSIGLVKKFGKRDRGRRDSLRRSFVDSTNENCFKNCFNKKLTDALQSRVELKNKNL